MKVTVDTKTKKYPITLGEAEPGKVYRDEYGNIFVCSVDAAVCLNNSGQSYGQRKGIYREVELLPAGTVVTLVTD